MPVARDQLKAGGSIDALAFESALWCRHCFGKTETGKDITAGDPSWDRPKDLASKAKVDPRVWLPMDDVYGDLGKAQQFQSAFSMSLAEIWTKGTASALAEFIGKAA